MSHWRVDYVVPGVDPSIPFKGSREVFARTEQGAVRQIKPRLLERGVRPLWIGATRVGVEVRQGHRPTSAQAQDFLMWVGAPYYPTIAAFLSEARQMGISTRVPALPEGLVLGKSRVFLAHDEGGRLCPECGEELSWPDSDSLSPEHYEAGVMDRPSWCGNMKGGRSRFRRAEALPAGVLFGYFVPNDIHVIVDGSSAARAKYRALQEKYGTVRASRPWNCGPGEAERRGGGLRRKPGAIYLAAERILGLRLRIDLRGIKRFRGIRGLSPHTVIELREARKTGRPVWLPGRAR